MAEFTPPEIANEAKDFINPRSEKNSSKETRAATGDPEAFFSSFKQTEDYQKALREREEETLARNPELPREKIEEVFLRSDTAKSLFHDFYDKDMKVQYSSENYSHEFNFELGEYFRQVRSMAAKERLGRLDRDDIVEYDQKRMQQHNQAAEQLVKDGQMPNFRLARVFIHFLSVSEGIDRYSPDRDEARRKAIGY